MSKFVSNWNEVSQLTSRNFEIIMCDDGKSAWIVPKVQGKHDFRVYLSSHLFNEDHYMLYTELLKTFGFNSNVVSNGEYSIY